MSDIIISAGLMVKDEQRGILAALLSLVGLADEIVIVDTGSTDDTIRIIERFMERGHMPVHLYHAPWGNDFGAMRMEVQSHCVGDWIFVLDGDERVSKPGNIRELMLTTEKEALGARIEAVMSGGGRDCHDAIRAYRRDRGYWQYPIHNQLMGFKSAEPSTCVIESYYTGSHKEGLQHKLARSIPILLDYHEKHPYDPHAPFFLAKSYRSVADWPQVRRWCELCHKLVPSEPAYAIWWIWWHESVSILDSIQAAAPIAEEMIGYHPQYGEAWHKRITHDLLSWAHFVQHKGAYIFQSDITGQFCTRDRLAEVTRLLGLPLEFRKEEG